MLIIYIYLTELFQKIWGGHGELESELYVWPECAQPSDQNCIHCQEEGRKETEKVIQFVLSLLLATFKCLLSLNCKVLF